MDLRNSFKIVAIHDDNKCEKILNEVIEYYIKEHKEEYDAIIKTIKDRFSNFLRYGSELDLSKGEQFFIDCKSR